MAKKKTQFVCSSCGAIFGQWNGKCNECGEWNTIFETEALPAKKKQHKAEVKSLAEISLKHFERIDSNSAEFNLVCGGGIVPGSVILIGGEPGIGKSTLALQLLHSFQSLYCSGEESPGQIRQRAERLRIDLDKISITTDTDIDAVLHSALKLKPQLLCIDSIQTVSTSEIPGIAGSVSQIRESAARLVELAKSHNITVFIIGHITKDGAIAGPKVLEHLVDTVLYFEGELSREYRILRAFKNRYGSSQEIGLFHMGPSGLTGVENKHGLFLSPFTSDSPGNAVSAALEGTRPLLFEVQSLVTGTSFSNPRRMADGFDLNRLIIIIAILEKHASLALNLFDVFLNVSGGFQIHETSADFAVAAAIASSLKERRVPGRTAFLGELSLSGELRPVSRCKKRAQELSLAGFNRLCISEGNKNDVTSDDFKGEIMAFSNIHEALKAVFDPGE